MFKVKWDAQNNGIILSDNITDEAIPAPRPVYLQELQILEVNKKYRMPKTDLPICWNIDARYYYKGQPFFERRGAGIYSKPDVIYNSDFTFSTLEPVDVDKMLEINREAIETMENEAMDFIMGCYETFKGKVDDYVVAFSGGKDSQVILDLVTRVLPVESFKAVFQDTDMELPCTYDIVAYTEEDYKYRLNNSSTTELNSLPLSTTYFNAHNGDLYCFSNADLSDHFVSEIPSPFTPKTL